MNELDKLRSRLAELHETASGIQARADTEKRELTVDELANVTALLDEFETVEQDIKRRERIEAQATRMSQPQARVVKAAPVSDEPKFAPAPADGLRNTNLRTHEERQRWGFASLGDFCKAVYKSTITPSATDARLITNAATTYGSEGVAADGGFAVPPEWRSSIMTLIDAEDGLLGRTDQQQISGNSITFPTDEQTPWASSGGIRVYWDAEAATISQSKPALKEVTVKTHRITALVPMTDELLEDAPAMSSYVPRKAGEAMAFSINDAIVNGTGAGQPLGIMKAGCLVTVSAEGSQVADTICGANVLKMMARMPARSFARATWLANQDCLPQIAALGSVITNAAGTVAGGAGGIYMPPGAMQTGVGFGTILGRPLFLTEACATLGDVGDIILADLTQYLTVSKGAVRSDVSIHLYFDTGTTAFRFVMRMNGQPWLQSVIARKNGSNTLSHFVALATRS